MRPLFLVRKSKMAIVYILECDSLRMRTSLVSPKQTGNLQNQAFDKTTTNEFF